MKKTLFNISSFLLLTAFVISVPISCKKETITQETPSIHGLWTGTYTVSGGASYFFSFSIFPDGKLSYKSKGLYNGSSEYITFADGSWNLSGNNFTFSVTTINIAGGGTQHTQSGSATYNSNSGTFSNGAINDPLGGSATWNMAKVN